MMTYFKQTISCRIAALILLCMGSLLHAAPTGLDGNGHLKAVETKTDGFSCTPLENGVQLRVGGIVKNVIFYGPTTVRVNENLGENYWKYPSIVVVGKPAAVPFKKACPLHILPLYVRAGSIVPMGPVMQYATEKPDAPYEIRLYPGADAPLTLYEDENETYNYEKDEHARVDLAWNDAQRTLTVGERRGSFPGMVAERQLHVVIATSGRNAGLEPGRDDVKTICYTGEATTVKF